MDKSDIRCPDCNSTNVSVVDVDTGEWECLQCGYIFFEDEVEGEDG